MNKSIYLEDTYSYKNFSSKIDEIITTFKIK